MKHFYHLSAVVLILLQACTTAPVKEQPQPAVSPPVTQPPTSDCAKNTWCWDNLVESKLTSTILAANLGDFCPKGAKLDRKQVYIQFVKAVSFAESKWNPKEDYLESTMGIDPITGKQVVSSGLMQLSYVDSKNWSSLAACKAIDYEKKNIHDPEINLSCALAIMDRLIARNPSLPVSSSKSLGAYWSSVREGHNVSRRKMLELMPECA